MQPVRQFDDDDPDIVHHRQQHFAEALRLAFLGGKEIQLAELGDAVHAARHVLAEILANILDSDAGILHHVVQQAGLEADQVHPHVRQEVGDHQRMNHVGVAGITGLELVIVRGEAEGFFERSEIIARPCFPHLGTQIARTAYLPVTQAGGGGKPPPIPARLTPLVVRGPQLIVGGVRF